MKAAVLRELAEGEKRVAAVPATVEKMVKAGIQVSFQSEAGLASGFQDGEYGEAGARVAPSAEAALAGAEVWLKVQKPRPEELDRLPEGSAFIASGLRGAADLGDVLRRRRITALSLDLLPRIARAQSMDVLSSMANIAGYKGVLLGANTLGKFFPMLMTAAGTVMPAKVLVLGAGVAGLQAIATARRLGAAVTGYDIRPAVKEQVESLGGRFLEAGLEGQAEDAKGYAKEASAEAARRGREAVAQELESTDVCITTALVPGKRAPLLVTAEMVDGMRMGSVIVDLAAEQGGNCEVTVPGKEIVRHGVAILGPVNLPSAMAHQASQLYARNVLTFLLHVYDKQAGKLAFDRDDEIVKACLIAHQGELLQPP
ncbi:MAG TPA: Re/Si-specific NAD(P)(+) transhydrogenase subunit alpha [Myxococcales bacterium]|nr:Re/Si-specific NAD(P)(+) transhydrogenase subunit alpha [Myxococcales bacterium]